MKKGHQLKIVFSLFILGIIIFSTGGALFLTKQKTIKQIVFAGGNCSGGAEDGQGCTNGGDLRNGCNWICNNSAAPGTVLTQPSCCEILAQTGDPFVCCFDARRRCTPQQCASIPEGVRKERCGQLWELGGYCNSPSPSPTAIPTSPIQTETPQIIPTEPKIEPTIILRVPPNEPRPTINAFPTVESITSSPQFEFPSINLPKINQLARKPLDLFEYLFKKIVYYDNLLEKNINTNLKKIISR